MGNKKNRNKRREKNISPSQKKLPRELRLSPVAEYDLVMSEIASLVRARAKPNHCHESLFSPDDLDAIKALAVIGLNCWRLRRRLFDADSGEPLDGMSMICRHVEDIGKALGELGLDIIDKTGHTYDVGLVQRAIAYEPTFGLTKETIIQTVKPTIALKGTMIERGEVIVGTPSSDVKQEANAHE